MTDVLGHADQDRGVGPGRGVTICARIDAASDVSRHSPSHHALPLASAPLATRRQGREWRAEGSSPDHRASERPYGGHQCGGSREPEGVVPVPPDATSVAGVERPLNVRGAGQLRLPGWGDTCAVLAVAAVQRGPAIGGHGLDRCHVSSMSGVYTPRQGVE